MAANLPVQEQKSAKKKKSLCCRKAENQKRSMQNEENRSLVVENMAEGIEDGIAVKLEVKMEDYKSLL